MNFACWIFDIELVDRSINHPFWESKYTPSNVETLIIEISLDRKDTEFHLH